MTASTSKVTLSRLIIVCLGTSSSRTLMSTRTILSTKGMSAKIPGPLSHFSLPSRKTTARSYCLTTLMDATMSPAKKREPARMGMETRLKPSFRQWFAGSFARRSWPAWCCDECKAPGRPQSASLRGIPEASAPFLMGSHASSSS